VVTAVVIVVNEGLNLNFQFTWEIVVFEEDAVFERLMPQRSILPWVSG
jgi:hypothetical protein